jgi:hypothetical protein
MKPQARRTLIVLAAVAGILLLFLYSTRSLERFSCEVCMEYGGRRQCRTAAGPSREEAVRMAAGNACQFLADGMTEDIQCSGSSPASVSCQER